MAIYTPPSDSQDESCKMKLVYFSNEFPHDDLQGLLRRLHNHSKDRRHPILARFIDEATLAIRDEVRRLPNKLEELIPPFETILNFADQPELRKGPLCGSVDGVLLCLVELGTYIGYVMTMFLGRAYCILIRTVRYCENFPDKIDFDFANTCLAGLGIGLLASAAVSLSPTLGDIPLAGAEVVRIAFRLGLLVAEVSQNLEARDLTSSPETWAYVVHDVAPYDAQKELDAIHTLQVSMISSCSMGLHCTVSRIDHNARKHPKLAKSSLAH
jgi:hypothetical protein